MRLLAPGRTRRRRSICSSSASAIPAAATPAIATTSAGWWSTSWPVATAPRWKGKSPRPGRRASARRAPRRAAEAGDVHERLRPCGERRRTFLQAEPDAVLVIHDEIDLEHGRLQARQGGGSRGAQRSPLDRSGLKTPDFLRLRIGVGRPGRGDPCKPADHVLSNFSLRTTTPSCSSRSAADAVEKLDAEGLERTQARYN